MTKTYISPAGNRRVYVLIDWKEYIKDGRTYREPINHACDFKPLFSTGDERVQKALEAHPYFNQDFIPMVKELDQFKPTKAIIKEGAAIDEREKAIKEAQILGIELDKDSLITMTTEAIKAKVAARKEELAKLVLKPREDNGEVKPVSEMNEMQELPESVVTQNEAPKRKGGRPRKAQLQAA